MPRRPQNPGSPPPDPRAAAAQSGRINQKLRTRQALLEAAGELVAEGATPALADVAERARVSKATAYRYFASADALVAEVLLDRHFPQADAVLAPAGDDPAARVAAVEAAVNDALLSQETAMRMILRNAIEQSLADGTGGPHRVGRRQALIAAALEPLAGRLPPKALARLRHALALVIGPEAIVSARDVCGLAPEEARKVTRWAARALLAQALDEAAEPSPRAAAPGPRRSAR